jgi:sugar phosphate isomerase/epimerase
MKKIKGPAILLAQFISNKPPFNNLKNIYQWASHLGYKAIQVSTSKRDILDLEKAAQSQNYCDDVTSITADAGLTISELSTHIKGYLLAAYDEMFNDFAPQFLHGNPTARPE